MLLELEEQCKLEYLNSLNLKKLLSKKRFKAWEGDLVSTTLKAIRQIFDYTVKSIICMGDNPTESSIIEELKKCIDAINELNQSNNNFMANIDNGLIYEEFEEIIYASGLVSSLSDKDDFHIELLDQWRSW
jgi:thermostable 8-oxoguanine DNA glycosylase